MTWILFKKIPNNPFAYTPSKTGCIMVKVPIPLEEAMSNPNISITSSPFAPGKMILKRASFKAGEAPEHLKPFLLEENHEGANQYDTEIYDGKPVPSSAAAVGKNRGGSGSGRRR